MNAFAQLQEMASSGLPTADSSRHPAGETQTTTVTYGRSLPYAIRLRGNFARRNSHDVCPISRAIISKKNGGFPTGNHYSHRKTSLPPKEHAPPFADHWPRGSMHFINWARIARTVFSIDARNLDSQAEGRHGYDSRVES